MTKAILQNNPLTQVEEKAGLNQSSAVDNLEPEMMRSGLFSHSPVVDMPNHEERLAILKMHTEQMHLANNVDLSALSRATVGLSVDDLMTVCKNVARVSPNEVGAERFLQCLDLFLFGATRSKRLSRGEIYAAAVREVGRAWLADELQQEGPVIKVTVLPYFGAGCTMVLPSASDIGCTAGRMRMQIAMVLAGSIAQQVVLGHAYASDDLQRATLLALHLVKSHGTATAGLGSFAPVGYQQYTQPTSVAPEAGSKLEIAVESEVSRIVDECRQEALELIERDKKRIIAIARILAEKKTLCAGEWIALKQLALD